MSAKRRAELTERKRVRQLVLERDGGCMFRAWWHRYLDRRTTTAPGLPESQLPPAYCDHGPLEVHELLSRARGGSITDPTNCVALCHTHHQWVTTHPAAAATIGLARSRQP
jgi:hypothetical protein